MLKTVADRIRLTVPVLAAGVLLGSFTGCADDSTISTTTAQTSYRSGYDYDLGATGYAGRPTADRTGNDPLRYSYYGLPVRDGLSSAPVILYNTGYVVGYDPSHRAALWVCYRLSNHDHATVDGAQALDKATTTPDPRLGSAQPAAGAAGSDRAWLALAPARAILSSYGPDAARETLLSSNYLPCAAPAGWQALRSWDQTYANANNELWVMSGPIFKDTSAAAPITALWTIEVVVQRCSTVCQAFILPVDGDGTRAGERGVDLSQRATTIAAISAQTGLTFLPNLPDAGLRSRAMVIDQPPGNVWPTGAAPAVASRSTGRE